MIELQHIRKQYENATPLEDVSVKINDGDVIAVIGPSGTGKSTLLRCINLLESPTSGHILIDGEDITAPKSNINKLRMKLGMVFQSFNLYDHLTVVENCMLAQTALLKRSRQEAYDKSIELLTYVGMEKRALQYPSQLSGGQKQRVAIARTLATDPEIILFDEPTSALDPITVGEVESVISKLSSEGRTMMIVTHSMEFARNVANRVFYMDQGGIYEDGTPDQIFNNPQKPRTKLFINGLTTLDMMITEENHDINVEIGKIHTFSMAKGLDAQRIYNICAAYEEYMNILDNYTYSEERSVHVSLEYTNDDKIILSFVPYSTKEWNEIESSIVNSLEYKLLVHYIKAYSDEPISEGNGIRYILEI